MGASKSQTQPIREGAKRGGAVWVPVPGANWICVGGPLEPPCLPSTPKKPTGGAVSISDLRAFRPRASVAHMEPHGWTVIGLDTDFWATTPNETESGPVLGKRADVRFEPVAWRWDYGDGTVRTATSEGGSWAALGVAEFDPTPSSHVYRNVGDYSIRLTVTYAAVYRYGGGVWQPVTGTIAIAAAPLGMTAGTADTVLTGGTCTAQPSAPGC